MLTKRDRAVSSSSWSVLKRKKGTKMKCNISGEGLVGGKFSKFSMCKKPDTFSVKNFRIRNPANLHSLINGWLFTT